MKKIFYFLLCLALFTGCGPNDASQQDTDTSEEGSEMTDTAEKKYTLTAFTPSKSFPDATIKSMTMKDGAFNFEIESTDYKLGEQTPDAPQKMCANSAKGQHIHVIVDDNPYAARYTASFDDLDVSDGEHYLLAFLSRSYHESIKTDNAHTAVKVNVAGGSIEKSTPIESSMLFYSRPKGTYVGKANTEKVMLDFYLVNASLGADYKVKADINGEIHMIDTWQPYYIEGLPMGKNTITLTLVDSDGNPASAPLNPVTREFELKEDELEDS